MGPIARRAVSSALALRSEDIDRVSRNQPPDLTGFRVFWGYLLWVLGGFGSPLVAQKPAAIQRLLSDLKFFGSGRHVFLGDDLA